MEYTVEASTATWRVKKFYLVHRDEHPWGGPRNTIAVNKRGQPVFYATRVSAEKARLRLQAR